MSFSVTFPSSLHSLTAKSQLTLTALEIKRIINLFYVITSMSPSYCIETTFLHISFLLLDKLSNKSSPYEP